jgi:NAD(P)-dependent dehydrogenase (short-subunit alcohol dehydrogenase family)
MSSPATFPPHAPRVVLVTGAARRLGRVIALELARHGWDIALHYGRSRSDALATQREIQQLGRRCELFAADLSLAEQVETLVPDVLAKFGTLDALVNSASRFEQDRPESFTNTNLLAHLGPNLAAPITLAQALHRHLAEGSANKAFRRGVVVNLLDQKLYNLNPDFFSYTLSKAALQAATTMMAQALAPHLRCVGVAPGLTMPSHLQTAEDFARTQALSPLGRASQPEDIASAVLFALNNPAITGTSLLIDGGQHLQAQTRDFSFL